MDIFEASRIIESLLRSISSQTARYSDSIRINPYETIMDVLRYHLPHGAKKFEEWYGLIQNRSLAELREDGYDLQIIISDLKKIINEEV